MKKRSGGDLSSLIPPFTVSYFTTLLSCTELAITHKVLVHRKGHELSPCSGERPALRLICKLISAWVLPIYVWV